MDLIAPVNRFRLSITLVSVCSLNLNCLGQPKQEVYDKINKERILRGLSELPVDKKLEKSAQSWAFFMPYRGVHNTNFTWRFKRGGAECIAWGDSPVEGWMKSKQHKAIIMGRSVKAMGAGYWRGKWVLRTFTQ
ncbi:MAG: CAP domain-containing protein [Bacteroidetes bacterium CHB5]|nr:CAP domain-containing protein [Bacteroidetes bacterium CHB5]